MDVTDCIAGEMEATAEWRHEKAQQFPDDERNAQAAQELQRLAKEIVAIRTSPTAVLIDAAEEGDEDLCIAMMEWLNEELRAIGFRTSYASGAEFLETYWRQIGEEQDRRQDFEEGFAEEELIERDPAVKAAKAAYDLVRIEARARLRSGRASPE